MSPKQATDLTIKRHGGLPIASVAALLSLLAPPPDLIAKADHRPLHSGQSDYQGSLIHPFRAEKLSVLLSALATVATTKMMQNQDYENKVATEDANEGGHGDHNDQLERQCRDN